MNWLTALTPQNERSARLAAIGLMLLAVALFSLGDALGKFLVTHYAVGQFILLRALVSLALLAPFIWRQGLASFTQMERPGLQALRLLLSMADVGLFFVAVVYLPLADVITYYLAVPIYVTAYSALVLREKVGWRRWSAVLAGFAGVLVALRPSTATLSGAALIALFGSFSFAVTLVVTRTLRGTPDIVLTSTHLAAVALSGAIAASYNWTTPQPSHLLLYLLSGLVSAIAILCFTRSLKLETASVVAPYQYTMIVWAVVLGYLVFGDVPTPAVLTGAAIIVAAGLYILLRERATGAPEPPFAPPP